MATSRNTGIYVTAYGPISLTNVTSTNHLNNYGAEINNQFFQRNYPV